MQWMAGWRLLPVVLGIALSVSSAPAFAEGLGKSSVKRPRSERVVQAPVFNWFANASPAAGNAAAIARTKAAIRDARSLSAGASWVCSPAGSGKASSCYQG
ncbi:MAG: hypothetical protein C0524_14440 [Rhodobacter sp.]|nr:hypothetical protein [Rhodobacter sp.]